MEQSSLEFMRNQKTLSNLKWEQINDIRNIIFKSLYSYLIEKERLMIIVVICSFYIMKKLLIIYIDSFCI